MSILQLLQAVARGFALALIFVIPWENAIEIPGLGTLARGVGLVAAGVWLVTVALRGHLRRLGPFHMVLAAFLLLHVAGLLWSIDTHVTQSRVITWAQLGVLSLLIWDQMDTPPRLMNALRAFMAGAAVSAGSTLWNWAQGVNFSHTRFSASGFNADDVGLILAIGMPVAFYLMAHEKGWVRWLVAAYLPLALFAIGLSGTRTAILASVPGFLYGALQLLGSRPDGRWVATVVVVVLGVVFGAPLLPEESLERLATTDDEIASGDLSGRTTIWWAGLDAFERAPILGSGSATFPIASGTGRAAHNSYLSVLVDTGLVGFALFITMLGIAGFAALSHGARAPNTRNFWLALLAAWAIGAFALTWEWRKQTWVVLTLTVAGAAVADQRTRQATP